jgi:hypothetical protein
MTETMMRDRAARLQIDLDALCDEASRLGFSIEIGRRAGDGRARFATYDVALTRRPERETVTVSSRAGRADVARSDHR